MMIIHELLCVFGPLRLLDAVWLMEQPEGRRGAAEGIPVRTDETISLLLCDRGGKRDILD